MMHGPIRFSKQHCDDAIQDATAIYSNLNSRDGAELAAVYADLVTLLRLAKLEAPDAWQRDEKNSP